MQGARSHPVGWSHRLARSVGQVELAQLQNDDLDAARGQYLDPGADVLGITVETVRLRCDEGFAVASLPTFLGALERLREWHAYELEAIIVPLVSIGLNILSDDFYQLATRRMLRQADFS